MKNKKIIIIISIIIITLLIVLLLLTGRARTDVFLGDYELSEDGKTMTLKVGVSSSAGYIRKMKRTSGSMNYYFTFYSTFGINSKLGAKNTFKIDLDSNVDAIYFYKGDKGYKQVLQKNTETGEWTLINDKNINTKTEKIINVEEKINKIITNGPMTSSNPFDYIEASQEDYNELLNHPKQTFEYAIKDLINTNANDGLKSYIETLLCSEINKNFEYDFESASDFLEQYKEFLTKSYTDFNDYDKYAKSLLN